MTPPPRPPSPPAAPGTTGAERLRWVPETKFGHWFLGTNTWTRHVVEVALRDLVARMPAGARPVKRVLDAGSGPGVSLLLLEQYLRPEEIVAIEIDPLEIERSSRLAARCACRVDIRRGDVARVAEEDGAFDLILCHQTLHHVVKQEATLAEFHRLLAPGGTLLLAESCREFILSSSVQWLFRHPNEVQKSAEEYQALVRAAGFVFGPENVQTSIPFWSRPDWGLLRKLGLGRKGPEEPTQVNIAALKPW